MAEQDWLPFIKRLEIFAENYCRKKPSLAMISEMAWTLGVEIDFRLVPREVPSPEQTKSG